MEIPHNTLKGGTEPMRSPGQNFPHLTPEHLFDAGFSRRCDESAH